MYSQTVHTDWLIRDEITDLINAGIVLYLLIHMEYTLYTLDYTN